MFSIIQSVQQDSDIEKQHPCTYGVDTRAIQLIDDKFCYLSQTSQGNEIQVWYKLYTFILLTIRIGKACIFNTNVKVKLQQTFALSYDIFELRSLLYNTYDIFVESSS